MENWKDINGYTGIYQINPNGHIRTFDKQIRRGYCMANIKSRILKIQTFGSGYPGLVLTKNGRKKRFSIHRLLALHFISNPGGKKYVNHKDGDKTNFALTNLEWSTQSENMKHAYSTGLAIPAIMKGDQNWASKIILDTQSGVFYFGIREASEARRHSRIQLGKKLRGERKNTTSLIFV